MVTRKEIGERVLLRRRELDMTQGELGKKAGCPYQVISRLENGEQSVWAERLAAIAKALGISTDYLLGLKKNKGLEETTESEDRPAGRTLVIA